MMKREYAVCVLTFFSITMIGMEAGRWTASRAASDASISFYCLISCFRVIVIVDTPTAAPVSLPSSTITNIIMLLFLLLLLLLLLMLLLLLLLL